MGGMRGYKVTAPISVLNSSQICEDTRWSQACHAPSLPVQEPSCQEMHWGMGHWAQTALPGLSAVPGIAQSFSLRFSSFSLPGYIYIFRTLCPASSKWCKISPLLCDFHSLIQRLEERISAIPYLRAQPPLSSSSLTSHLFPLIALHRILSCRQDLLPFHSAQWELPQWAENVLFT